MGLAFAISSFEGRRFNRKAPLSTATAIAIESAISHYSDTTHPDPISHFPLLRFLPSAKVELTGLARATRRGLPCGILRSIFISGHWTAEKPNLGGGKQFMSVIDADAHVIATKARTTATPTTPTILRLSNTRARRQNQPIVGAKNFRR